MASVLDPEVSTSAKLLLNSPHTAWLLAIFCDWDSFIHSNTESVNQVCPIDTDNHFDHLCVRPHHVVVLHVTSAVAGHGPRPDYFANRLQCQLQITVLGGW